MGEGSALGVDFGTSTTLLAEGRIGSLPQVLPVGRTTPYLPSVVGEQHGELVVGEAAEDLGPGHYVRSVKRAITRRWRSLSMPNGLEIDADMAIIAVLRELAVRAEDGGIDLSAGSLRLGCPAAWDAGQRQRLLGLARRAGLGVEDHTLIDEPVAAGIAWMRNRVLRHRDRIEGKVLVFDMGGGTLDVAVLDVEGGPGRELEIAVLSSLGEDKAGDDLDAALGLLLRSKIQAGSPDEPLGSPELVSTIGREAREAKVRLSSERDVPIRVRTSRTTLPVVTLTRAELEREFRPQMAEAMALTWSALRSACLTHEVRRFNGHHTSSPVDRIRKMSTDDLAADVTYILPVGGMSRVPLVLETLTQAFPRALVLPNTGIAEDEAVASGLSDPDTYERISLNRPAFDFVLIAGGREFPMYEAYTPLYPSWHGHQRSVLYHESQIDPQHLPRYGSAEIVVRTPSGERVAITLGDERGTGLDVSLGHCPIRLHLYTDGRVTITDGKKVQRKLRVRSWPAIRGSQTAELQMTRDDRAAAADVRRDNRFGRDGQ